jgi:Kef-type K+ transport system membrane component KefB
MEHAIPPILVVLAAAALAPIVGMATGRLGLPIVVIELLLGVAIGPQGLALVAPTAGMLSPLPSSAWPFCSSSPASRSISRRSPAARS